ncbi:hypothetical protein [Sporosarcina limicola]|uniref:Uncharacterized protein n=1 Tax=Sporosarcina limicola TaxID=34101 RepID=A0A927MHL9_9BACL|nr:hypothetical protein [Sporosarcina limicola]MBE1554795.1 hypothetical protein [Sporosarcina limicola]
MKVYDVCNVTDRDLFEKCFEKLKKIEDFNPEGKVLEDVDGSLLAVFKYQGTKVVLLNDEQIGALYIKSEMDIEHLIFN